MKKYEPIEFDVLSVKDQDVIMSSPTFTDDETGDNGVWFPGFGGGDL